MSQQQRDENEVGPQEEDLLEGDIPDSLAQPAIPEEKELKDNQNKNSNDGTVKPPVDDEPSTSTQASKAQDFASCSNLYKKGKAKTNQSEVCSTDQSGSEKEHSKACHLLTDEQWEDIFDAVLKQAEEEMNDEPVANKPEKLDDFEGVLKVAEEAELMFDDDEVDNGVPHEDIVNNAGEMDEDGVALGDGDYPAEVEALPEQAAHLVNIDELDDEMRLAFVQSVNETSPVASDHEDENREKKKGRKKKDKKHEKLNKFAPKQLDFTKEKLKPKGLKGDFAAGKKLKKKKKQADKAQLSKKAKLLGRSIEQPGTWVQCDDCAKWRHLADVHDPCTLPEKWTCFINKDESFNSCSKPEQEYDGLYDDDNFVYTEFTEGSLVWAKMTGFPWWPGMIDVDPDLESFMYFEKEKKDDQYHVVFFGEKVSRCWLKSLHVRRFTGYESINTHGPVTVKGQNYKKPLKNALADASKALAMTLKERLTTYGFASRFSGKFLEEEVNEGTSVTNKMHQKVKDDDNYGGVAMDTDCDEDDDTKATKLVKNWSTVYSDDDGSVHENGKVSEVSNELLAKDELTGNNGEYVLKQGVKKKRKKKSKEKKSLAEIDGDKMVGEQSGFSMLHVEETTQTLKTQMNKGLKNELKNEKKKTKDSKKRVISQTQELPEKKTGASALVEPKQKKVKRSSSQISQNDAAGPKIKKPCFSAPKNKVVKAQVYVKNQVDSKAKKKAGGAMALHSDVFTMDVSKDCKDISGDAIVNSHQEKSSVKLCVTTAKENLKNDTGKKRTKKISDVKSSKSSEVSIESKHSSMEQTGDVKHARKVKKPKFAAPVMKTRDDTKEKCKNKEPVSELERIKNEDCEDAIDLNVLDKLDLELTKTVDFAGLNDSQLSKNLELQRDSDDSQPFDLEE